MTLAKQKSRKQNPDPVAVFANLMGGVASALSVHKMLKGKPTRRRSTARKVATARRRSANPATRSTKPGGALYVLTISRGDDIETVYLHDGKGDGFGKKFRTMTAARAYATKNKVKLHANPGNVNIVRKRNVDGFVDASGTFHPIRESEGYSPAEAGERGPAKRKAARTIRKRVRASATKKKSQIKHRVTPAKAKPLRKPARSQGTVRPETTQPRLFNGGREQRQMGALVAIYGRPATDAKFRSAVASANATTLREAIKKLPFTGGSLSSMNAKLRALRKRLDTLSRSKTNPLGIVSAAKRALARGRAKRELGRELRAEAKLARIKSRKRKAIAKATENPKPIPRRRTFEMFNGREASQARELEVSRHAPKQLDQLGGLVELKLGSGEILKFNPASVALCASRGKLWIAGRRFAKVNPQAAANEINPIDTIDHVVYTTHKPHHGDAPGTHYIHKLGEDTGHLPTLCVDREGFPVIRGGKYKIEARGIVN